MVIGYFRKTLKNQTGELTGAGQRSRLPFMNTIERLSLLLGDVPSVTRRNMFIQLDGFLEHNNKM